MKKLLKFLFLFIFALSSPIYVNAQIINEISSGSNNDDWVEIYNNTSNTIDLSQYKLEDSKTPEPNEKLLTGMLEPESFFVIDWSNRLNFDGDTVYLKKVTDNTNIDYIKYGSSDGVCVPDANQSIGRYENGNVIERFEAPTKGITNIGANILPCPTPSPSPSPTPQPTITPTPTQTPTQTKSPTPTPLRQGFAGQAPSPIPTKTPTSKPTTTPSSESEVMGLSTTKPLSKNKNQTLPIIFILSGVLLIGFAVLQLVNAKKTAQNSESMGASNNLGRGDI